MATFTTTVASDVRMSRIAEVASDARTARITTVASSVQIGPPPRQGGLNKPYSAGVVTLTDARGNSPDLAILGFPLPLESVASIQGRSLRLATANVYLKQDSTYQHLESAGVYGTLDHLEYYYFLLTAVHGESYAVNWTMPDGTITPNIPIDAEVYFPPIPDPERQHTNAARVTEEHVRRATLVLRQNGERAVLFRRRISGTFCSCHNRSVGDANRDCPDCFGVGFVGGYDVYPYTWFREIPAGTRLEFGEAGIMVDSSPRAWTLPVPVIADRDMFVRNLPQGRLRAYEIHNVTRRQMEGPAAVPVLQEFSLKRMEHHDPIYRAMNDLLPSSFKPVETGVEPGIPNRW